jgi:hypothetical protein
MSTREKIILFMALAALVYGGLEWFVFSSEKPSPTSVIQKKGLSAGTVDKMMAKIMNMEIEHPHKKAMIEKIETPWVRDPFVQPGPQNRQSTGESEEAMSVLPNLVYSGFISSGKHAMAIVNGMEYFTGDIIMDTGYRITRITPDKVIIQKDQNTGEIFFNGD